MGKKIITVEGELTIYTVQEHKQSFLSALEDASRAQVKIDLSHVTEIDGAGLQLLLWLEREAKTVGYELKCKGVSETVKRTKPWPAGGRRPRGARGGRTSHKGLRSRRFSTQNFHASLILCIQERWQH